MGTWVIKLQEMSELFRRGGLLARGFNFLYPVPDLHVVPRLPGRGHCLGQGSPGEIRKFGSP